LICLVALFELQQLATGGELHQRGWARHGAADRKLCADKHGSPLMRQVVAKFEHLPELLGRP